MDVSQWSHDMPVMLSRNDIMNLRLACTDAMGAWHRYRQKMLLEERGKDADTAHRIHEEYATLHDKLSLIMDKMED